MRRARARESSHLRCSLQRDVNADSQLVIDLHRFRRFHRVRDWSGLERLKNSLLDLLARGHGGGALEAARWAQDLVGEDRGEEGLVTSQAQDGPLFWFPRKTSRENPFHITDQITQ